MNSRDAYTSSTQRHSQHIRTTKKLLLQVRVTDPKLDEKEGPQSGRSQKNMPVNVPQAR